MNNAVKQFCARAAQSGVVTVPQVRAIYRRWVRESGNRAANLKRFTRWLVATHYLTDYQARRLQRGHTDCLVFDQYKILRRIGEGPLARVYKAIQTDGSLVALKVLPPSRAADPRLQACFEREVRVSWRLKHPNVVRALGAGEADGVRYLVLEYLDGETLAEVLRRRGRLRATEAVRLIYQAFLGLQHIHECGLVHGAIEPANLMLTPAPSRPGPDTTLHATVKLLDLGVGATFLTLSTRSAAAELRRHGTGSLPIDASELAPEQVSDPAHSDIRADIYALGCVLYHCLAGQPPFPGGGAVSQILRHATAVPRPLQEFVGALPAGLQEVVDRLLAKDPARRYPTPAGAACALRPFLPADGEPRFCSRTERPSSKERVDPQSEVRLGILC
jgi:serine/threonine protein kinase